MERRPLPPTAYFVGSALFHYLGPAFAVRRARGAWRRVDVDDSPPYRGFLEPASFRRKERVQVVAVARSSSGAVVASKSLTVVPRP